MFTHKVPGIPKTVPEVLQSVLDDHVAAVCPIMDGLECVVDFYVLKALHSASLAFLKEYEAYKADPNSVIFVPTPEVLEAFRKAVRG